MTLAERVGAAVSAALTENRIVGAVVAVMHRGTVVLLEAWGAADREAGRAMAADSIFLIASVTKPIATATILGLVERGVLDLDAPVTDWLPEFRPRLDGVAPAISLRQLLTHTSGLSYPFREPPDSLYHRLDVSSGLDQPGLSGNEQLRRLGAAPLLFAPGTRWNYSLGVDVAGLAAAAATGRSLGQLVGELVTEPLGMEDSAFRVRDLSRLVTHYGVDASGLPIRMWDGYAGPTLTGTPAQFAPSRIFHPGSYHSGGGGMASTATDLLAFLECLRRGGAPILERESARKMTTNAIAPGLGDVLEPGWGYSLGAQVLVDASRNAGPESGGAFKGSGGYGHVWLVDPVREISMVALTNSAPEGVRGRLVADLRSAVYAGIDG